MTTSVREAIRERLDPVIEEIVSREISERGSTYQQYGQQQNPLASVLPFLLMSSQQQAGQQQQQNPLASILPILLMTQQQQPQQQQNPLASILPILLMTQQQQQPGRWQQYGQQQQNPLASVLPILLMSSQQQQPGFGQQQQPFGALAPVLFAALSQR